MEKSTQLAESETAFKTCGALPTNEKTRLRSRPTSTLSQDTSSEYCGVPYEQFEVQIQRLCQLLWPIHADEPRKPSAKRKRRRFNKAMRQRESVLPKVTYKPKQFVVERMRGGGYNSVLGIEIIGREDETLAQMVLRVPRMGSSPSEQDVVNLQFVQEYLSLPTAEIIAYDFSKKNPLNSPYMLQRRLPGHDLESLAQSYPSLSHKQKLAFVEEFCETILLGMQFVQYPWIGQINKRKEGFTVSPFEALHENEDLVAKRAERLPFFKERPLGAEELTNPPDPDDKLHIQSVLHFFEIQFGRHRNRELPCNADLDPSEQWDETIWHRLVKVARQMYEFGCLDSEYTCLTHYDLDPRNIMLEIQPDGTPTISGIIDWDLACFAPEWVGCKPPMWIWNWLDGGSEDESKADDEEGLTAEQKELKHLFDEAVGFKVREFAYQPHYRIARALFKFARFGCPSAELREEAERACEEWEEMYRIKQAAWEERQKHDGVDDEEGKGDGGSGSGRMMRKQWMKGRLATESRLSQV